MGKKFNLSRKDFQFDILVIFLIKIARDYFLTYLVRLDLNYIGILKYKMAVVYKRKLKEST